MIFSHILLIITFKKKIKNVLKKNGFCPCLTWKYMYVYDVI